MTQSRLKSIYEWVVNTQSSLLQYINQYNNKQKVYCNKCETPFQKDSKRYFLRYKGEEKIICDKCYNSAKLKAEKKKLTLSKSHELNVYSVKSKVQSQKSMSNYEKQKSHSLLSNICNEASLLGDKIIPASYDLLKSYSEEELILYAAAVILLSGPDGYGVKALSDDWKCYI